jgi:uroporphyrinogen-III synthase
MSKCAITLFLGLDPSHCCRAGRVIHYPVIRIVKRPLERTFFQELPFFSHFIFTSKTAVHFFFCALEECAIPRESFAGRCLLCVGKFTAAALKEQGFDSLVAEDERQEGVIALLAALKLDQKSYFCLPRSFRARLLIDRFLQEKKIRFQVYPLYDTAPQKLLPLPDLKEIDEIVFTSPSTVDAFYAIFPELPREKILTPIGPVTRERIVQLYGSVYSDDKHL